MGRLTSTLLTLRHEIRRRSGGAPKIEIFINDHHAARLLINDCWIENGFVAPEVQADRIKNCEATVVGIKIKWPPR